MAREANTLSPQRLLEKGADQNSGIEPSSVVATLSNGANLRSV